MGYFDRKILFGSSITDIDVLAFLVATGVSDYTQKQALNFLVLNLKANNLWSRLFALYPFIGGTAATHKYNLKNSLDTDAAFRLVFGGTVTHNSNGVSFSTNGYANSKLVPSVVCAANNQSYGLYSRTSSASATANEVDMGSAVSLTQRDLLIIRNSSDTGGVSVNSSTVGAGTSSSTVSNALGFFTASRTSATNLLFSKNGTTLSTASTTNNGFRSSTEIYLGCRNVSGVAQNFSARNFALAFIGADYSAAEIATFYTIVQNYQTMLSRQV